MIRKIFLKSTKKTTLGEGHIMQRCEKCGQENNNYAERCVYCGEFLYIAVDHDDIQYNHPRRKIKRRHNDFTEDIIDELSNSNNEASEYMDIDDNPFTQAIEKNSYHEKNRYINDDYIDESFINPGDSSFHDLEVNNPDTLEEEIIEELTGYRQQQPPKKTAPDRPSGGLEKKDQKKQDT